MSTIRKHLAATHTAHSEHHLALAQLHKEAMDGYEPDDAEHVFHKGALETHLAMGEYHAEAAKECMKADADELDKAAGVVDVSKRDMHDVNPDHVSGIAGDVPQHARAIPRFGSPAVPDSAPVDSMFEKIFATEDDDF